jgi:cellulose biosynthesis protein BcsQ
MAIEKKTEPGTPQVISFLSGKGGAGKTSVAISMAHLLNDVGFRVLLIDFDFATNGASYFFKYLFQRRKKTMGLAELLESESLRLGDLAEFGLEVKKNLYFLPSRVNFSKKIPLHNSYYDDENVLINLLLDIKKDADLYFDFILVDNQAGSSVTSKVSAGFSDKVIIVAELDPISSDAIDTLLIQIGDSFPEYRRHLINKLDVRESEEYKKLNILFQNMNRLPPLPFDFEVRAAFSSRQIPINVNEPTTFLIALFNTVKAMLPEYREELDEYGQKILDKFNEYQNRFNKLLDSKEDMEREVESIREKSDKRKRKLSGYASITGTYLGATLAVSAYFGFTFWEDTKTIVIIIGLIITVVGMVASIFIMGQSRAKFSENIDIEKINSRLADINKEIDSYKSFMLTRTKDFLMNFEQK